MDRSDLDVSSAGIAPRQPQNLIWELWLSRAELGMTLLLVACALALHVRFATHVGALWRDEANSVNLATVPTLAELWQLLDYDSFPVLYLGLLRGWTGMFGVMNDSALRALGCVIGLGIVAALCFNARALGARWPVLSLALLGLNPMFIRYGDSTRAYGLGILLILLTFGAFWRLVQPSRLTPGRVLLAAILAVLSVHTLYYNSVLLFATAMGAIAVAARTRAWGTVVVVIGIGGLAAISLLPYAPMIRRVREWSFLVSFPADFPWLWYRIGEVLGSPDPLGIWLWVALVFCGLATVTLRWRKAPAAVLFATVALFVGGCGYALFLRALSYYTQPWYYITLVAFTAGALEVLFGGWASNEKNKRLVWSLRSMRILVAVALLSLNVLPAWEELPTRHTNLDLVAKRLEELTMKGDVILVPGWECAITLSRYYHGPAKVLSLPPIDDHRFHRYDLVLQKMTTPDPIQPVLAFVEQSLRSGSRAYLAGSLPLMPGDQAPVAPPPAFRDEAGVWHGAAYSQAWELQVSYLLQMHAARAAPIPVPLPRRVAVQGYENVHVVAFEGWH